MNRKKKKSKTISYVEFDATWMDSVRENLCFFVEVAFIKEGEKKGYC